MGRLAFARLPWIAAASMAMMLSACATTAPPPATWTLLGLFHHQACEGSPPSRAAAELNGASLYGMRFAPFGRPEQGWATYAPAVEQEIETRCPADSGGFADALRRWQGRHGLAGTGVMSEQSFMVMKAGWQTRRPFVILRSQGVCPAPPSEDRLVAALPSESYGGKRIQLRPGALDAYRRMVAEARRDQPALAADRRRLQMFSGFRSPAYDAARCAMEDNCQGVVRAACSAHRTGLAFDVVLDTAPGYAVDSSADPNRLAMAKGLAYRWMVANARRFGFVNYAFEPWHWEWTGEKP